MNRSGCGLMGLLLLAAASVSAQVSIPAINTPVLQDFDSLANAGTTNTAVPAGWAFVENPGDANYAASTGSSTGGNTYSFGATGNTERAFGMIQSGSVNSTIGASFRNDTGATVNALVIQYFGEQWRLGEGGRTDRIDFQYSLNATSIVSNSTWVNVNSLDFSSPDTTAPGGARNGNDAQHRVRRVALINNVNLANGATFFIRFTDLNADGSDDGLAVDDFQVTAFAQTPAVVTAENLGHIEGDVDGTANVRVSLAATVSAAVTFNVQTVAGTATAGVDYQNFAANGLSIAAGSTATTVAITIEGDTDVEPAETFDLQISGVSSTLPVIVVSNTGTVVLINDDPRLLISQIQGNGNTSPQNGNVVSFEGIVTGVASRGYFVQEEDADADADPLTSEGIFVFLNQTPDAAIQQGARIRVVGTVTEFNRSPASQKLTVTEIVAPVVSTVVSSGNPLPVAAALTVPASGNAIDLHERHEGMRVSLPGVLRVVGPTDGSMSDTTAAATAFGTMYVTMDGIPRPFREPGTDPLDLLSDVPTPCARPCNDSNEEIIGLDTDDFRTAALELSVGQTVSGAIGPLHYDFGGYFIVHDNTVPLVVGGSADVTAAPVANGHELTIASFNMQRLYDDVDDATIPFNEEPVVTPTGFQHRLGKFSAMFQNALRMPDIVGVIEVENLVTLQRLADRINADAGANNPEYGACLVDGPGFGRLDVGFLYKQRRGAGPGSARRIELPTCANELIAETYVDPRDGSVDPVYDRPPLRLNATVNDSSGASVPVTVIVNHFLSLLSVSDTTVDGASTDGERGRQKRKAQAERLANFIHNRQAANPNERIVVIGDFNAFEFSDGYGDIVGGVMGLPAAPADQLTPVADLLLNGDLTNLSNTGPSTERYSYVEGGSAQVLDHILVNAPMAATSGVERVVHARANADFANAFRDLPNDPRRSSDHDAVVAYFDIPVFNDLPVVSGSLPNRSVFEGEVVSWNAATAFTEPEGELLSYTSATLPTGLSINPATGEISGTVGAGTANVYTVTVSASDGAGSVQTSFQLTVTAPTDGVFSDGFE
ncbi:MAG: putative Ig domain-containing protein [Ahniella sp.]|nr:putative Ig domain-containing protein [Ahniella sp.]